MTKAQRARLARIKAACETVEDELNRLDDNFEQAYLVNAMHVVIRHLKARWGELNAEPNGGTDAAQSARNGAGRDEGGA